MAKTYTIDISGHVTICVTDTFEVEADSLEEAIEKAEHKLHDSLDEQYGWCDLGGVEVNCVEVEE